MPKLEPVVAFSDEGFAHIFSFDVLPKHDLLVTGDVLGGIVGYKPWDSLEEVWSVNINQMDEKRYKKELKKAKKAKGASAEEKAVPTFTGIAHLVRASPDAKRTPPTHHLTQTCSCVSVSGFSCGLWRPPALRSAPSVPRSKLG